MMHSVVFNNLLLPEKDFRVTADDRGFRYGDGIFETIRFDAGTALLFSEHLQRLALGAEILGLRCEPDMAQRIEQNIHELLRVNHCAATTAKVNVYLWRSGGGTYRPTGDDCNLLIKATAVAAPPYMPPAVSAAVFEDVRLSFSMISSLKKLNALPYVLAARYAVASGVNDCVLTDVLGRPAECGAANLFWFSKGVLCTPSLLTGCVAGTYRKRLLTKFVQEGRPVKEDMFSMNDLKLADYIFACNAFGVKVITQLDGRPFADTHPLASSILLF